MRLDAYLTRHLDQGAAAEHWIRKDLGMQSLEDVAVNAARSSCRDSRGCLTVPSPERKGYSPPGLRPFTSETAPDAFGLALPTLRFVNLI